MTDISGFQSSVTIIASNTFPFGIIITSFADDVDPIDFPEMQIGDSAMGLNGDLLTWSKANPIKTTLAVIPNSPADDLLSILFEANRVGYGKVGARDIITLSAIYPNGEILTFKNGIITDGMPALSVASSSRLKTKTYSFSFENL